MFDAINVMNKILPALYAIPLILLSTGIGYGVSAVTKLNWLSAAMFSAVAMILVGTWIFEDDANDVPENSGDAGGLKNDIRKNNTINYLLVLVLAGLGVWLQVNI